MTETTTQSVLSASGVVKNYPIRSGVLRRTIGTVEALRGVDLDIPAGRTIALVGESGSGKTTLARCILGLEALHGGQVTVRGTDGPVPRDDRKAVARMVQVVFQDPATSLSPRMRVRDIVGEPLRVHGMARGAERARMVAEALESVGIPARWGERLPHNLSGGERQRVAIARALILRPRVVVLDEPVSALDVSVQAQILVLLAELQERLDTSYLLISHDLGVVRSLADDIYVMYLGRIVEHGSPREVLSSPRHPYTRELIEAEPSHPAWSLDNFAPRAAAASGPTTGCRFRARCPVATDVCASVDPELTSLGQHAAAACHNPLS